jgi:UDP-N-acetylmuramoyl-tripeptide--D-alanyl-D-alanine ligase
MAWNPWLLEKWTSGRWHTLPRDPIEGFGYDTRRLQKGELFLALSTPKDDGHRYLEQAWQQGASAALVSRLQPELPLPQLQVEDVGQAFGHIAHQHRCLFEGPVVGITGSCGKTSTKDLLALLLGEARTLKTPHNLNNQLGVPYTLTQLEPQRHRFAVVEAGMNQPGEMAALGHMIAPNIALVTQVAHQHLEGVGSLGRIAHEKFQLVAQLRQHGLLIAPASLLQFEIFRSWQGKALWLTPQAQFSLYHEYRQSHPQALCIPYDDQPDSLVIQAQALGHGPCTFDLPAPMSAGMRSNAALALACALSLGIDAETLRTALRTWQPSAYRGQWVQRPAGGAYLDCYNSGPLALQNALEHFQALTPGSSPRLYVIGSMHELGEASQALHYAAASHVALRPQDQAILIGPEAQALHQGLLDHGAAPHQLTYWDKPQAGLRDQLAQFEGAFFIKGSAAHALWQHLPDLPEGVTARSSTPNPDATSHPQTRY